MEGTIVIHDINYVNINIHNYVSKTGKVGGS